MNKNSKDFIRQKVERSHLLQIAGNQANDTIAVIRQLIESVGWTLEHENIALVLEVAGKKSKHIRKKVKSVLRTVGMEDRLNTLPPSLSGGEQQRVAVARAVVGDPEIILADEPTGNLDAESAEIIFYLLRAFHERGATVIIATHDMELIRKTGGRVIQLKEGRLIMDVTNPITAVAV